MLVRDSPEAARLHLAAFARQKQFSSLVLLLLGGSLALCWRAPDERALIFLGVLGGLVLSFSVAPAFDARTRIGTYMFFSVLRQTGYLAAVLALWFFARGCFSALVVLIAAAGSFTLQVFLEWRWVRRNYGGLQWQGAGAAGWELLRQGTPMAVAFAAMQALTLCGPPLLETLGGAEELGLLVASNQLAMAAVSFLGLLSRLAHARLAAIPDTGGAYFRSRAWLVTLGFTVAGAGVALPLMLCSDWLVPLLFGRKFAPAAAIFAVDVWRCVGVLAGAVLGSALICQHRVRAYAVCQVLALFVGLAVAWRFIPAHGAVAAAAAVAVGRAAFALCAAFAFLVGGINHEEHEGHEDHEERLE
jgi:O-antigen/teichoic acid export membrane protein